MKRAGALRLVVGRELREATRRKTFWIILAIAAAGSTAAVTLPEVFGGERDAFVVGVVDTPEALGAALVAAGDPLEADITVQELGSVEEAQQAVDDGDVSIAVVGGDDPGILATAGEDERLVAAAQQVLAVERLAERLVDAGVPEDEVVGLLQAPPVRVDERDTGVESRRGAAAIISVALYLVLLMLTLQVANSTAIEKANRISEVLLAIVRPAPLLFGKVIATGIVGLSTLVAGALPVVIKLVLGGDLPEGIPAALAAGGAWYVLGGATYLTIAGALGALVERQEEAGSAVSPLTMLILAAYIVGQSASGTPIGRVLAIFPLTSALVMPPRIAVGEATAVEIVVSLGLSAVTLLLAVRLGAGIYRRAVVRTGRRLKIREVLRAR